MAKLPVAVEKQLRTIQDEMIPHLASVIVRKEQQCENLPEWFNAKDISYYKGMMDANYSFIESMLQGYKCYNGFNDTTAKDTHVNKYDIRYRVYYF